MLELEDELKAKEEAKDNSAQGSIEQIQATLDISETKSKIEKMQKLVPLEPGSVLEKSDIQLLRDTIMPEQAQMFRRVLAFIGYYDTKQNKHIAPNLEAFSDDFDPASVNAEIIDTVSRKLRKK
jgi:hypothetical protein